MPNKTRQTAQEEYKSFIKYGRRKPTDKDKMLMNILRADNAKSKRELIATYNPFHYIFGTALTRQQQEDLLTDVNEGDENE